MEVHDRKDPVQTHALHVSNGRDSVLEIRHELFGFPEVLDVFATGRQDVLVVVCAGRPRPAEWLRALRAVGYETSAWRHASIDPVEAGKPDSEGNGSDATLAAAPGDPPPRQIRRRSSSRLDAWTPTTSITPCS